MKDIGFCCDKVAICELGDGGDVLNLFAPVTERCILFSANILLWWKATRNIYSVSFALLSNCVTLKGVCMGGKRLFVNAVQPRFEIHTSLIQTKSL